MIHRINEVSKSNSQLVQNNCLVQKQLQTVQHSAAESASEAEVLGEANISMGAAMQKVLPVMGQLRVELDALRALCKGANDTMQESLSHLADQLAARPVPTFAEAATATVTSSSTTTGHLWPRCHWAGSVCAWCRSWRRRQTRRCRRMSGRSTRAQPKPTRPA